MYENESALMNKGNDTLFNIQGKLTIGLRFLIRI